MPAPVNALAHDRRIAEALLEISHAVGSVMELQDILQRIVEIGARVMETNTCSVYLRDEEEPDFLTLHASKGLSRAQELGVRGFRMGDGIPGWAAVENRTIAMADASKDPHWAPLDDTGQEVRFVSYLCTPLRIQEQVVGIMSIRREHAREWTDAEILFAEIIAKQVAIVLEKAQLYREKMEAERLAAIAISFSGIAHYIKNVLQNMMGGAFFVQQGLEREDLERAKRGWELLKRSTDKIAALVENMLMYAREREIELVEHDVNALIQGMANQIRLAAAEKDIDLEIALDQDIPQLRLDEDAIHDALLNMVTNALDAIGEAGLHEGRVEVVTRWMADRRMARIEIRDNGPGIPDEVKEKMFNLFFSTKGRAGTGIGLSVSRRIIDEHGGNLWFESEPGEGTTFFIELPVS